MTNSFVLVVAACALAGSAVAHATPEQTANSVQQRTSHTTRVVTGRAFVNGIHIYYEVHGRHDGVPLVLLHGGGSTIESNFGRMLPLLAGTRRVVALEEQGTRSHVGSRSAVHVRGFCRRCCRAASTSEHLQADLLGFSNGANVALQVAIRYPQIVRSLVFASSFTKREGRSRNSGSSSH